jgi:hypothetical protein
MPVAALSDSRYSYISFESVNIVLEETKATVTVDYSIDSGVQILVMFLGNQDLKNKIERAMNFKGAKVTTADLNRAVLEVESASYDYGDKSYWFPPHTFLVPIPEVTIQTPQVTREMSMLLEMNEGIGYFAKIQPQQGR